MKYRYASTSSPSCKAQHHLQHINDVESIEQIQIRKDTRLGKMTCYPQKWLKYLVLSICFCNQFEAVFLLIFKSLSAQTLKCPISLSFHLFHSFIYLFTQVYMYGQHEADVDLRPINNNTMSKDQTTTPGTPSPTLFDKCVGSLTPITVKMQETGPRPRRLEYLTICRCHCKGSIFSSVILRPWVLVRSGLEPETSRSVVRRSTSQSLYPPTGQSLPTENFYYQHRRTVAIKC